MIKTSHGYIETPIFMPVGTCGAVKTLSTEDLEHVRAQIILGNTYHLYIRPGDDLIKRMDKLHKFMSWDKPILTDSGGFQVMSLQGLRKITEEGVHFRSHLDGSSHLFSPEKVIDIQMNIGADIMMVFDECPSFPATKAYIADSMKLTLDWARRCKEHFETKKDGNNNYQSLFGIVQGGIYEDLREECTKRLIDIGFPGYAIGGLAVGEGKEHLYNTVSYLDKYLPKNKPRYLMGVGTPEDLLECIGKGVDMFDCVMPTRNARKGTVFTSKGKLILKAARHKEDRRPIDEECQCYTCRTYSRAYLRHLFNINEMSAYRLASIHSLYYYIHLVKEARKAIIAGEYNDFCMKVRETWEDQQSTNI